jgi:clan AA aspartic protease
VIVGEVSPDRQALVEIEVRKPGGDLSLSVDALVDTGFSGALAVTPDLAEALELELHQTVEYEIGDGSVVVLEMYRATIVWDGTERTVLVTVTDAGFLVGMKQLAGYNLSVDVVDGGPVRLTRLP